MRINRFSFGGTAGAVAGVALVVGLGAAAAPQDAVNPALFEPKKGESGANADLSVEDPLGFGTRAEGEPQQT